MVFAAEYVFVGLVTPHGEAHVFDIGVEPHGVHSCGHRGGAKKCPVVLNDTDKWSLDAMTYCMPESEPIAVTFVQLHNFYTVPQ